MKISRLLLQIGIAVLLIQASAWAHIGHHADKEKHEVTLRALGDRLALEYRIETIPDTHEHATEHQQDQGKDQEKALQILALQTLKIDGRVTALNYCGMQREQAVTVFRYDTGPASFTEGEYDIDYIAKSGLFADDFSFKWDAVDGSRFIAPGPRVRKKINLICQAHFSGKLSPNAEPATAIQPDGMWAGLIYRIQNSTGASFWFSVLGICFVFGMLHALGPGHGKSLAAAYLVDRKGMANALVFAVSTTITHTMLAFILALLAYLFSNTIHQAEIMPWMQLGASGLMIAIGAWLLYIHISGRHIHLFGGHGHHHPHDHEHDHPHGHGHHHPHDHEHAHPHDHEHPHPHPHPHDEQHPDTHTRDHHHSSPEVPEELQASVTIIGRAHTPYDNRAPYQPTKEYTDKDVDSFYIELHPDYADGLNGLDSFSHLFVVSYLDRSSGYGIFIRPPWTEKGEEYGLFATRAPSRPSPIGLTRTSIQRIEGGRVYTGQLDLFDGTPILDIKPFIRSLDGVASTSEIADDAQLGNDGWLEGSDHLELHRRGIPHDHPGVGDFHEDQDNNISHPHDLSLIHI